MADEPAECFPVGDYIREEMDARGWGLHDLMDATGIAEGRCRKVLRGKKAFAAELEAIAAAFGISPVVLLRLQGAYIRHLRKIEGEVPPC